MLESINHTEAKNMCIVCLFRFVSEEKECDHDESCTIILRELCVTVTSVTPDAECISVWTEQQVKLQKLTTVLRRTANACPSHLM